MGNNQLNNNMQIILTKQDNGRWFGRINGSDDGNGNEIDCLLSTPERALNSLLKQHERVYYEE